MSTESENARKAELAKWLVKVNPEMAKDLAGWEKKRGNSIEDLEVLTKGLEQLGDEKSLKSNTAHTQLAMATKRGGTIYDMLNYVEEVFKLWNDPAKVPQAVALWGKTQPILLAVLAEGEKNFDFDGFARSRAAISRIGKALDERAAAAAADAGLRQKPGGKQGKGFAPLSVMNLVDGLVYLASPSFLEGTDKPENLAKSGESSIDDALSHAVTVVSGWNYPSNLASAQKAWPGTEKSLKSLLTQAAQQGFDSAVLKNGWMAVDKITKYLGIRVAKAKAQPAAAAKKLSPKEVERVITDGQINIVKVAGDLIAEIERFFINLNTGLSNFEGAMVDARFDKLEEKDNSELISKALEIFVGIAFPEEKIAMILEKKAAEALKEIAKAIVALSQVEAPSGTSTYHEFVIEMSENAAKHVKDQVKSIESSRDKLGKAFEEAANVDIEQGRLVLQAFEAMRTNVLNSLKGWDSPKKFEQVFATKFAGKKGDTGQSQWKSYDAGTLYFIVVMRRTPSGSGYTYDELGGPTWRKWTLVTKGSSKDADGAVKALMESSTDKLPWKMNLPRKVKLELREKTNEGSRIASAWLVFNAGNTSEKFDSWEDLDNGYYGQTKTPLDVLREAWSHVAVRAPALSSQELEGDTKAP